MTRVPRRSMCAVAHLTVTVTTSLTLSLLSPLSLAALQYGAYARVPFQPATSQSQMLNYMYRK